MLAQPMNLPVGSVYVTLTRSANGSTSQWDAKQAASYERCLDLLEARARNGSPPFDAAVIRFGPEGFDLMALFQHPTRTMTEVAFMAEWVAEGSPCLPRVLTAVREYAILHPNFALIGE